MSLQATASQTVGPFFRIGLKWLYRAELTAKGANPVHITGHVLDGDGAGVGDAVIEVWQADPDGRYHHPEDLPENPAGEAFDGFIRVPTNAEGVFSFTTVKPGRVPGPSGSTMQAPHLNVSVMMRGLLKRMPTRMYFPDDDANRDDPVLATQVPPPRRETLIARPDGAGKLRWDIHMQGERETVFFDF